MSDYNYSVECPFCDQENDMTDWVTEPPRDNHCSHECEHCHKEFDLTIDYDPMFYASKPSEDPSNDTK